MVDGKRLKGLLSFLGLQVLLVIIVLVVTVLLGEPKDVAFAFLLTMWTAAIIHELGHGVVLSLSGIGWQLNVNAVYCSVSYYRSDAGKMIPWVFVFLSLAGVAAQIILFVPMFGLHSLHVLNGKAWLVVIQSNAIFAIVQYFPVAGSDGSNFWSRMREEGKGLFRWQKTWLIITYLLLLGISIGVVAFVRMHL
ncbi:MAG TPA: hypothetical protein VMA75_04795 [Candidatus Paceibacterota bacterium]|nr:hypothetical protein [Candidatus Paceibacterota bacterium]